MEPLQQMKGVLEQFQRLSPEAWEAFSSRQVLKQYKKGEYLCREGMVENSLFFLLSGAVRNYFTRDGKEFTVEFHFSNEFVTSYYSFITRQPSKITIEAIEEVRALVISHHFLHDYYKQFHEGERIGRLIAEAQYIRRLQREMDLLSLSAEERYARLLQRNPALVSTLSVRHLSSYLGIQPESLSRIRRQYGKN